ncbi:41695_t:CDS:1, partial [Gigaspora margarita]
MKSRKCDGHNDKKMIMTALYRAHSIIRDTSFKKKPIEYSFEKYCNPVSANILEEDSIEILEK